jgi:putative ABC transport system permease protein
MALVATIARRSLLQRPARTLFSVLGIGVGIATVVTIFTLDHNTLVGRARSQDPDWRAEIEVSPSAAVRDPRAELAGVPGILDAAAAFQNEVILVPPPAEEPAERREAAARVHLVALEAERAAGLEAYAVALGRDLEGAGEVLLGDGIARRFDLAIGDTVQLSRPQRAPGKECVEGEWRDKPRNVAQPPPVVRSFTVVGLLGREGIGRMSRGEVVVLSYGAGRALFEGTHVETRYWLKHDREMNLERLQANLGKAWSYDLKRSVIIGQAADERAFRNGVRFAGLLALVLGLFVIFHTLSMSLMERVREVGVLHALGTTRAQIANVFLAEACVIAGAGAVLGLGGGLALARLLLLKGVTTTGFGWPVDVFEVPWTTVAPLCAAGVGIALVGSVFPLARVRHTRAVEALRSEQPGGARGIGLSFRLAAFVLLVLVLPWLYFEIVPVIGEASSELVEVLVLGLGILAVFVSLPLLLPALLGWVCARLIRPFERLWPLSGMLAGRAMQVVPTRVAGATAGIALVTAAFVGLRGMTGSLEREIELWGREAFMDKVFVRNLPPTDFAALDAELRRYPGVLALEPNEARTYVPFLLVGVKPGQLAAFGPCKDDPRMQAELREGRGVILSQRLARHRRYAVGDPVHVTTPSGSVQSLTVVAISDAYGYFPHPDERLYGVVSDEFMRRSFCLDTEQVTKLAVRLAPGADPRVVETAVRALVPEAEGLTFEDGPYLWRWHTSDIRRDFILFDIILFLTAALAGLGVLNGLLLSALERAKELGILHALGMSARQVAGMVLLESAVVGGLGGALGLALGAALAPVIVGALQVISGLALPAPGPGRHMLIGPAGALLVALLAGLYPIWRMHRASAVAAVRSGG